MRRLALVEQVDGNWLGDDGGGHGVAVDAQGVQIDCGAAGCIASSAWPSPCG